MDLNIFSLFFVIWGSFIIIASILSILLYVLYSLGLYTLAKNLKIKNTFLAWIPIANLYILGEIVKSVKIFNYDIENLPLVLTIGAVIQAVFINVPVLSFLISICFAVILYFSLYELYKMYRPESAVLWLILSLFIIPIPILIFIMRNDKQIEIQK